MEQASTASRRRILGWIAHVLAGMPLVSAAQATLTPTPSVSVGPFYPPEPSGLPFFPARPLLPLPQSDDLTAGPDGRRAEGERIRIGGSVRDTAGRAIPGARIEIWQVDARGHYAVETGADRDPGFAGYGTTVSGADGGYRFVTIRPPGYGRYGGLIQRTAHIHMRVAAPGRDPLATEIWFADDPGNARDSFVRRIVDAQLRQRMLLRFKAGADGMPDATFDVVLADHPARRAS